MKRPNLNIEKFKIKYQFKYTDFLANPIKCNVANFISFRMLDESDDPISYNERKRKRLGEEVHEGFLHPKQIKLGQITLKSEKADKELALKKLKSYSKNNVSTKKHKFQFK